MAEEIKFTDEELKSLSELSQGYQNIQSAFGQMRVQKILLEQQKDGLEEAEVWSRSTRPCIRRIYTNTKRRTC